jgi:hypothetical protein
MSIKRILSTLEKTNLVPDIQKKDNGPDVLRKIGARVVANHKDNVASMAPWSDLIKTGLDVAKLETAGASYPWENAANYKSPLITEAVRQFGDRAKTEIMTSNKLVACKIEGVESTQAHESVERIEKHMNWQINSEMRGWRTAHTKSLYALAATGTVFKKTYYDATEGCNKSNIIKYPNFSLDQQCCDFDNSNFTQILYYYSNDVFERKAAGLWEIDDDLIPPLDSDTYSDEDFEFLEQFINYDVDGDGYDEPLIVTVHVASATVVRIVPRFDVNGLHVEYKGNTYNLKNLIESRTAPPSESPEFNEAFIVKELDDIQKNSALVRIVPEEIITTYNFIEPTDGTYLSIGYLHLLSSPVKGVNKSTNALLNAGELANLQGGWLSKEHRDRKSAPFKVKAGYFAQTNISAVNLQNSVVPLPIKEPSATLLALNNEMKADIKDLSARFNSDDAMKSGVSAASVLGALQEGVIPTSSLILNVVNAMSHEFSILFRLNALYTEPKIYLNITGAQTYEQDYGQNIIISPTANAMFSNQMQRITLAQAQLDRLPEFLQIGGDPEPIVKGYYEALGTPNMDELFPQEMTSEQEQRRAKMLETQEAQLKALQQQNQILQAQIQLAKTDTERRVFEAQTKAQKDQADLQQKAVKLEAEIANMSRKMMIAEAETQMKLQTEMANLQKTKAETLQKLAQTDKLVNESAQIEQTLAGGDINAIQALTDDDLLAFIGVSANG